MNIKLTAEQIIESIIIELGLKYEKEVKFSQSREWKFDYSIIDPEKPGIKCALEIEGGSFGNTVKCHNCNSTVMRRLKKTGKMVPVREGGRHNSGTGFAEDCVKYNTASILGWTVLRYTTDQIQKEPARISKDILFVRERGRV